MKFSTFIRHLREGSKNIVRNGWMSIASIGAVTVTLILVGTFVALMLNINEMTKKVENDDEIEEIGEKIEKIKEVDSMNFSSKNDELESLINSFGDEGEAWGLFEQDNPLNHAYVIKTKEPRDTEKVASEIEEFDNVQKV